MLVFWLLGLYVLTRGPRSNVSRLAALAQLLLALYLLGQALRMNAPTAEEAAAWGQRFWFGGALTPAVWYWLTAILFNRAGEATTTGPGQLTRRLIGFGILLGCAFYAATGYIDDLLFRWSQPAIVSAPWLPNGLIAFRATELYAGFVAVTLFAALTALLNLRYLWATSVDSRLRARFLWLTASAALFTLGGGYLTVDTWLHLDLPQALGHLTLALGLALVAWNVLQYNALLEDQVLTRDFLYFISSLTLLALLYISVVLAAGIDDPFDRLVGLLLVVSLALVSHALSEFARQLWDRVFYRNETGELRSTLRALTSEAGLAPRLERVLSDARIELEALEEKQLRIQVEDALRKLNNLPALSAHPLQNRLQRLISRRLGSGTKLSENEPGEDTSLARARALRQLLVGTIERLKPTGERTSDLSGGWIQYLTLYEAYVLERQNRQIMARHYIGEGTFNRNRRQAITGIARDLLEQEKRAGGQNSP